MGGDEAGQLGTVQGATKRSPLQERRSRCHLRDVLDVDRRQVDVDGLFARLFGGTARRYRVSVVTNATPDVAEVIEKDVAPGTTDIRPRPLPLAWPRFVFSLSHIAVPFPLNDPLYCITPDLGEDYGRRLGQLEP